MALIDEPRAQAIYDAMGPAVEMSGGSAANTIVGLGFARRARRLHRQGQGRHARPAPSPTTSAPPASPSRRRRRRTAPRPACCYVLVTPDGERTMNTYLGAAQDLTPPTSTPTW